MRTEFETLRPSYLKGKGEELADKVRRLLQRAASLSLPCGCCPPSAEFFLLTSQLETEMRRSLDELDAVHVGWKRPR